MRRSWNRIAVGLGCWLLAGLPAAWADTKEGSDGAERFNRIATAMQDRAYRDAIAEIDLALAGESGERLDELAYLKGRALHHLGEYDEAADAFDTLVERFPDTDWHRRARFAKAAALARKGNYREAELIYRDQAEMLLSDDRRMELAAILLDFADAYFSPGDTTKEPDFPRARTFYEKALEIGLSPSRRAEVRLLIGQCFEQVDDFANAAASYTRFVDDYQDSDLDVAHLEIEARYRLGWCHLKQNAMEQARRAWEDLLASKLDDVRGLPDETADRFAQARFHLAATHGVPSPGSSEDLDLGLAAIARFLEKFADHELAPRAELQAARSLVHRGRYADAARRIQSFVETAPSQQLDEVAAARFLAGICYLRQQQFDRAIEAWRDYLSKHPAHHQWDDAQRAIINTRFAAANDAFKNKHYARARQLWQQFLIEYPLDDRAAGILTTFGQMHAAQENWKSAIEEWQNVVAKYPGTEQASSAQFSIASTYESRLNDLEQALKEYKRLNWGSQVAAARQRIAALTSKQLVLKTLRVYRSDEQPQVNLSLRNVESVQVKVYTIDLETYFRKMHLARGVEQLDVALIDPDVAFTYEVPDYQPLVQSDTKVTIPLRAAAATSNAGDAEAAATEPSTEPFPEGASAVLAVTVSSDTLEATTLVIRSDLDMIVKSSRDELFVFAENMRTGKPWPGARILVSDGSQVLKELTTNDEGILQHELEELKSIDDVRVFAVADGHSASNLVSLAGVGVSQGLATRGFIETDRPAYRGGQLVHIRGVIRRVDGDRYVIDEGKKYDIRVVDPRGRELFHGDATLNAYGCFAAYVELPLETPAGEYRIDVKEPQRDGGRQEFAGAFIVQEYNIEPVRLVVDTERNVFYRGEVIEGTLRAEFYYGAPLADREIRYQFAGEPVVTAKTDDRGEVRFKLSTRKYRESMPLPLVVTLPERNLNLQKMFILATRGFSIGISTARDVFLAAEPFEARITTPDAEGEPRAQELTVELFAVTHTDGVAGERRVHNQTLTTSQDKGLARVTLTAEQGGQHIIRVSGEDRFGNPITAEHRVEISDDDDRVRLRILAEQHTFKVGDEANIRVHWREQPALALVTFQGARILGHRLVQMQEGDNTIAIPMAAHLAPNFDLSVAVMTDPRDRVRDDGTRPGRFHEATTPITVQRQLEVALEVTSQDGRPAEQFVPGDELKVAITTQDPQGKPVAADVSVALVEEALLDRFSGRQSDIAAFFRGRRREAAVRTTSTAEFAYQPETHPIDVALLAERDRLIWEEQEELQLEFNDSLFAGADDDPFADAESHGVDTSGPINEEVAGSRLGRGMITLDSRFSGQGTGGGGYGGGMGGGMGGYGGTVNQEPDADVFYGEPSSLATAAPNAPARGGSTRQRLSMSRRHLQAGEGRFQAGEQPTAGLQMMVTPRVMFGFESRDGLHDFLVAGKKSNWDVNSNGAGQGTGNMNGALSLDGGVVFSNNRWYFVDFEGMDDKKIAQVTAQAGDAPGRILSPLHSPETGFWNPSVQTDDAGRAEFMLTLPTRSTSWKLFASGITLESLAGRGELAVTASKSLFGQLKVPPALVDGDEARIVAAIHNDAVETGQVDVLLTTRIGKWESTERKQIDVTQKGIEEIVFAAAIDLAAAQQEGGVSAASTYAVFELKVEAGDVRDVVRKAVLIRPYGQDVVETVSGTASSDTTDWIELPADLAVEDPRLQIVLGPNVQRSLLDVVLGSAPWCRGVIDTAAPGIDSTSSNLLASTALLRMIGGTRQAGGPDASGLDSQVRSALANLVAAQSEDGGWTWSGVARDKIASDPYVTSRAAWALSEARGQGYVVQAEAFDKAIDFLRKQLAKAANDDYETRAILLHALTECGREDFAQANRLYRNRPTLSAAGVAYAALTFHKLNRREIAQELLAILSEKPLSGAKQGLSCNHAETEVRALAALAAIRIEPAGAFASEQLKWILSHRRGFRWSPDKATGPATIALVEQSLKRPLQAGRYDLDVYVNNNRVERVTIDKQTSPHVIEVPADFLDFAAGRSKQAIRFELAGRGQFTYHLAFGGFVPYSKLKSTTNHWRVERTYEPAQLELDGKPIARGFGIIEGRYQSFSNSLSQLPVGKKANVRLRIHRQHDGWNQPDNQLDYLVVTEPIPSGATVVEDSIRGAFERYELGAAQITFFIGNRRNVGDIHYDLHGYVPGQYRAGPSVVHDAYLPGRLAIAKPKDLKVLPLGQASTDAYRLTPVEQFELGKHYFNEGDWRQVARHLSELLANWNVNAKTHRQAIRMTLDAYLELGPPHKIVETFEIMKEKWPELEIPFAKIVKIGGAYHEMGEYERSYMVFRATVQSQFMREVRVAGFLDEQQEFLKSVDLMSNILRQYPPEGYVAAAEYALAQQVYEKAASVAADAKLREQKVTRVSLVRRALGMLPRVFDRLPGRSLR